MAKLGDALLLVATSLALVASGHEIIPQSSVSGLVSSSLDACTGADPDLASSIAMLDADVAGTEDTRVACIGGPEPTFIRVAEFIDSLNGKVIQTSADSVVFEVPVSELEPDGSLELPDDLVTVLGGDGSTTLVGALVGFDSPAWLTGEIVEKPELILGLAPHLVEEVAEELVATPGLAAGLDDQARDVILGRIGSVNRSLFDELQDLAPAEFAP